MTKINMTTYNNIIKLLKSNSEKLDNIYLRLNSLESKNNFARKFTRENEINIENLSADELDKHKQQIAICLNHQWNIYRTNYWKNINSKILN